MTWSKKNRYRLINDAKNGELENLEKNIKKDFWRQFFHIMPKTGLLNDPNGLAYYDHKYHVFFQWFPFGPVHGLKHWGHYTSSDLINWEEDRRILIPDEWYEKHGAFSGSAIIKDEKLYLMYTGNVRDENWSRKSYQCLAYLGEDKIIKYTDNPIIGDIPENYTNEFRDPKLFIKDGNFYFVIGAQRKDKTSAILIYKSDNLKHWNLLGEIKTKLKDFAYMWECPDYFELDNNGILLFCPQGLKPENDKYNNIYQSAYITGEKLNINTLDFQHNDFNELDRGFDFYAPQTFEKDNRRILIGWMGLPELEYPTDKNLWAHCLTIPRELKIKNGKLIQNPVIELQNMRKSKEEFNQKLNNENIKLNMSGSVYELIAEFSEFSDDFGLELRSNENKKTILYYDYNNKKVILDRTNSGEKFALEYGTERRVKIISDKIKFHIFMDSSSIEVFVNDGEEVFSARIFPDKSSNGINIFSCKNSKVNLIKWNFQ